MPKFQSAPHFSSEANTCICVPQAFRPCFNPRLPSAARRTSWITSGNVYFLGFNPRLTSAARRTQSSRLKIASSLRVSIRASLQQRGEHRIFTSFFDSSSFQSAPHFSSEANLLEQKFV